MTTTMLMLLLTHIYLRDTAFRLMSTLKGYVNEVLNSRYDMMFQLRDMSMPMVTITPLLPLAIMLDMETNMTSDMDTHMDMEKCWT